MPSFGTSVGHDYLPPSVAKLFSHVTSSFVPLLPMYHDLVAVVGRGTGGMGGIK